jgi:hypothetical protein
VRESEREEERENHREGRGGGERERERYGETTFNDNKGQEIRTKKMKNEKKGNIYSAERGLQDFRFSCNPKIQKTDTDRERQNKLLLNELPSFRG